MGFVEIAILCLKSNCERPCVCKNMAADNSGHQLFEKGISITGTLTRRSVPNCCSVVLEKAVNRVNSCQPPCVGKHWKPLVRTSFLLVQGHPLHNQPENFSELINDHGEYACALLGT